MNGKDWWSKPATFHARAIARGLVTSSQLVEYYIARILAFDGAINAVVVRCFEDARSRAALADAATARGETWGPLHGVPITIKEAFHMKNTLSTCAVPELKDFVADSNAPAVQRLLDAGAVVLGKTNLPVAAMDAQSYNGKYGTTNNPWDLNRSPGGSSGGSAAAIAAGLSVLELGSDIGGSIRNPAHFCGVCGHKPTQGIVPFQGHSPGSNHPLYQPVAKPMAFRTDPSFGHPLPVAGPIARTCADLELAMRVVAGPEPYRQANGWNFTLPPAPVTEVGALRVACWLDEPFCPVEKECVDLMMNAAEALKGKGAHVDMEARPDFTFQKCCEAYFELLAISVAPPADYSLASHQRLMHKRWRLKQRWLEFFAHFDVLLCPIMPCTALLHQHGPIEQRTITVNGTSADYNTELAKWAGMIIFSDLPSTVVPVGKDSKGLPFGMQIVAAPWQDLQCIEVGKMLERLGFHYQPPGGYGDERVGGISAKL